MTKQKSKRTHKSALVFWAIGITALIGLAFLLWPKDKNNVVLRGTVNLSQEGREHVNGYLVWAERATIKDMEVNHEFAALGLSDLSEALRAISESTSDRAATYSGSRLQRIETAASQITKKPDNLEHSNLVKDALIATQEVLLFLQEGTFPALSTQLKALNAHILSINEQEPFLNQKEKILETHKQIAAIIRVMIRD